MSPEPSVEVTPVTRRSALRVAAGTAGLGLLGVANGEPTGQVRVTVGYNQPSGARATRAVADERHHELPFGALTITTTTAARRNLETRSDIAYVEADETVRAIGGPVSGYGGVDADEASTGTTSHRRSAQVRPWGIDRVDADVAHHNGSTGRNIDIAIVDTGIDRSHVEFLGNLGEGVNVVGGSITRSGAPAAWHDDNGHGTHVAGIANAANNRVGVVGVSTAATLHAVKALTAGGVGLTSDVAAGLVWVADRGYPVANMSIGGPESETLKEAVAYAHARGVTIVAAAGNAGPCEDCVTYPAAYDDPIAVSAIDRTNSLATFSSAGPEVDIAAPGANILSTFTGNTYASLDGTSMATPHVTGAIAQAIAAGGTARTVLSNTEDVGLPANESGRGVLDVAAALGYDSGDDSVGSDGGSPPVLEGTNVEARSLAVDDPWRTYDLTNTYGTPVVLAKPPSFVGSDPCHARVRSVREASFECRIEEWLYLNGGHYEETVGCATIEAGRYELADGRQLESGTVETDDSWVGVSFDGPLGSTPVVLTQAQTENGWHPTVTRVRNVSADGFDVRLQEEEANGPHVTEVIGYLAVEPGVGSFADRTAEAGIVADRVTDEWYRIEFDGEYTDPVFVGGVQSFDGPNTCELRNRNLSGTSVDIAVEEERSGDRETNHTTEDVGYLVVEG